MSTDAAMATGRVTFHCTRCQQYIGDVLGPSTLRINGIVFLVHRRKDLICPRCGHHVIWFAQSKRGVDKPDEATTE